MRKDRTEILHIVLYERGATGLPAAMTLDLTEFPLPLGEPRWIKMEVDGDGEKTRYMSEDPFDTEQSDINWIRESDWEKPLVTD